MTASGSYFGYFAPKVSLDSGAESCFSGAGCGGPVASDGLRAATNGEHGLGRMPDGTRRHNVHHDSVISVPLVREVNLAVFVS